MKHRILFHLARRRNSNLCVLACLLADIGPVHGVVLLHLHGLHLLLDRVHGRHLLMLSLSARLREWEELRCDLNFPSFHF